MSPVINAMEDWHLSDQATSSKGQKSCQLTSEHQSVRFQLGTSLRTRFGASCFEKGVDAPRRNLDFDITDQEEVHSKLLEIDSWVLDYITQNSERLLKKKITRAEVESAYTPLVRQYGAGSSCKTKINLRGLRACTFWNEEGEEIKAPDDGTWTEFAYDVFVAIPQLWIMQGTYGLLLETTALRITQPSAKNPFL